jgi:hypothetical protein
VSIGGTHFLLDGWTVPADLLGSVRMQRTTMVFMLRLSLCCLMARLGESAARMSVVPS